MNDQPTCGMGLAEHAALPAKLGELIEALAATLEAHLPSLPLDDANAKMEHDVYSELARDHRDVALRLAAIAAKMTAQRALPMGAHDEKALADPAAMEPFARFVRVERELTELLEGSLFRDEAMLA